MEKQNDEIRNPKWCWYYLSIRISGFWFLTFLFWFLISSFGLFEFIRYA